MPWRANREIDISRRCLGHELGDTAGRWCAATHRTCQYRRLCWRRQRQPRLPRRQSQGTMLRGSTALVRRAVQIIARAHLSQSTIETAENEIVHPPGITETHFMLGWMHIYIYTARRQFEE